MNIQGTNVNTYYIFDSINLWDVDIFALKLNTRTVVSCYENHIAFNKSFMSGCIKKNKKNKNVVIFYTMNIRYCT